MPPLAERTLELELRGRLRFGIGAIEGLPELIGEVEGRRAFIVSDPGVVGSGVVDRVRAILEAGGVGSALFAGVEPNPGTACIRRGSEALLAFGTEETVVVALVK